VCVPELWYRGPDYSAASFPFDINSGTREHS